MVEEGRSLDIDKFVTMIHIQLHRNPTFALLVAVSRPIILTGLAVFLPFGDNIAGQVSYMSSIFILFPLYLGGILYSTFT